MVRYIVNRVLSGMLTLFLFVTLLFFLASVLIPGDFVTSLGPLTAGDAAAARESLGLDRPLPVQYLDWLGSLSTLSLGVSSSGSPVWDLIRDAAAPTLAVLGTGLVLAFALGGWLGRTAGYAGPSFFTGSMTLIAIVCLTVFPPALAVAMEQGVRSVAGWSGLGTFGTVDENAWLISDLSVTQVLWRVSFVVAVTAVALWLVERLIWRLARRRVPRSVFLVAVTGISLLVWSGLGLTGRALDIAGVMALLTVAIVLLTFGEVVLVTKAAMDDVMLEDYVMVARAKGLTERQVRDRHAARTALLPVLSRFTVAIPYFLTGLVILEVVFAGSQESAGLPITGVLQRVSAPPGLGTLLFRAVADQDMPMVLGALLVVGVITLVLRIALDVVHAALDPRIRFAGGDDAG
jgi:peptide/nickel transport system permease protein